MFSQTDEMKLPKMIVDRLLQAYYFEQACRYYHIEDWSKYSDVEIYAKQLAVSDIDRDNK